MKRYVIISLVMLILASTMAVSAIDFENTTIRGLNITTDVDGALSEAQIQNKSVALLFDQDSCVYCEILKDDVLSNSTVQKELNEKYIVVLVDINKNPEIAGKYDIFGTPTIQFLKPNGTEAGKIEGYLESDEFLNAIKEI
ncbi:thioredoxin family protein [Methanobrevibacter sp.]|uniref:thioredoxin family protein n=1 Tax=Methanobrevibacter sp. TaxID=66852 RepID=UPI00388F85AA